MENKTCCDFCNSTSTTANSIPEIIPYIVNTDWINLERPSYWNMRLWHVMFICISGFSAVVILFCCCCKFRIPRTKQEIEADYIRRKITRKFTKQLKLIHNSDMDEMDLKKALDKIRSEFKSETESIILPDAGLEDEEQARLDSGSYRKASDLGVDIEELIERRGSGIGTKFTRMVGSMKMIKPKRPCAPERHIP